MRELDHRQHRQRRLLRRDQPARHRAQRPDHHQHRWLQREARRQREHHDLGKHAQHPQPGNGQSAQPRLLPGDRRKGVIGGVAALDQRRRHDDGEKAAVAQQRARAAGDRGGPSWCRPAAAARGWPARRARRAGDDPDQVSGGDHVEQHAADQRAEPRRRPSPTAATARSSGRSASRRAAHRHPSAAASASTGSRSAA